MAMAEVQTILWRPMDEAPEREIVWVLTADFGPVAARYEPETPDPVTAQRGTWVALWEMDGDSRLFCGATPEAWAWPRPKPEFAKDFYDKNRESK